MAVAECGVGWRGSCCRPPPSARISVVGPLGRSPPVGGAVSGEVAAVPCHHVWSCARVRRPTVLPAGLSRDLRLPTEPGGSVVPESDCYQMAVPGRRAATSQYSVPSLHRPIPSVVKARSVTVPRPFRDRVVVAL